MRRIKTILFFLTLFFVLQGKAQSYFGALNEVQTGWNSLELNTKIIENSYKHGFKDLRVLEVLGKDTSEVPYLINSKSAIKKIEHIGLTVLNKTERNGLYFFTFDLGNKATANSIDLTFENANYQWQANLEGSNDGLTWFVILKSYTILSFKNSHTNYAFNSLYFDAVNYKQLRLSIATAYEKPMLITAKVMHSVSQEVDHNSIVVKKQVLKYDKLSKQTQLNVFFEHSLPLVILNLEIKANKDYFRNARLLALSDSFLVKDSWIYQFETVWEGVLSSFAPKNIKFSAFQTRHLRLIIDNYNDLPLKMRAINADAIKFNLLTQLISAKKYVLHYGNHGLSKPVYDLERFISKVPLNSNVLELGEVVNMPIDSKVLVEKDNLKHALWAVLVILALTLGWFSFKMLNQVSLKDKG